MANINISLLKSADWPKAAPDGQTGLAGLAGPADIIRIIGSLDFEILPG